jgi:hypothetical protein
MRYLVSMLLLVPALWLGPNGARAEGELKIKIEKVQLGFPVSLEKSLYKADAWTPVYVHLTNEGTARINSNEYVLVVETTDSEDVQNHYTERRLLPPLNPNESTSVPLLAYTRPGGETNEVTVYVQTPNGKTLDSKKPAPESYDAAPFNAQMVLLAGSKLHRMKTALVQTDKDRKQVEAPAQGDQEEEISFDVKGPLRFVSADKVEQLPARWFGYGGVDLVVLTTGREEFIKSLLEDQTGRKEALAEWVRRGGRLVISAGRNWQFVNAFLRQTQLLPCELTGTASRPALESVTRWSSASVAFRGAPRKDKPGELGDIEFTQLVPGPGVDVLARESPTARDAKERPVIVQGASGLGRVLLVAFDLDTPPFTSWQGDKPEWGQDEFWKKLAAETDIRETKRGDGNPANRNPRRNRGQRPSLSETGETAEVANSLQMSLENFDDVPVISFGWVALFIFIYILIVGPIDYFFLKKVVKRLELTWITFPAVVLTISVIAYFTAYWLKGNELKINKVDVVDIDLASSRAYGTTWVTLYSPRIQNYTVGVEPAPAHWNWTTPKSDQFGNSTVLVDWMARPESDWEKRSQQGILSWNRPTYRYAEDAAGLEGVPIRVWATKSFTSQWKMALSEEKPLFEADLRRINNNDDQLAGTITSRLPVDLEDVVLFYKGKRYKVGRLTQDQPRSINDLNMGVHGERISGWFGALTVLKTTASGAAQKTQTNPANAGQQQGVCSFIKSLLFHSHEANPTATTEGNSLLRYLDQGWRIRGDTHNDEVVLFGRAMAVEDDSDKVSNKEVSASRLWLGALPGSGTPHLDGKMSQETYVRVYIPLQNKP